MTTVYHTTTAIVSGIPISSVTTGEDHSILAGVTIASTDGTGAYLSADEHLLTVAGTLAGDFTGAYLGFSSLSYGNQLTVTAGGLVQGGAYGAFLVGQGRIANWGSILSGHTAVNLEIAAASTVVNHGVLSGGIYGLRAYDVSAQGNTLTVTNLGTIEGGVASYTSATSSGFVVTDLVTNRGTFAGRVELGYGNDRLDNRGGEVLGDLDLGAGNDRLDNRDGLVTGSILGGAGNDFVLPGLSEETIDGGDGRDLLDFRTSQGLRVSLRDATGTREAAGDTYLSIEYVYGSGGGADHVIGSDAANLFYGFGGNDTLEGWGGNDRLVGGPGIDRLTGGAGNDLFQFDNPLDGGDLILDFGSSAGNDDVIRVSATGFGAGLVAGALPASRFVARADNVAQDADDRFVFRTTDATLWWDPDGSGAAAPVLIADLQAGATLAAADILVF